MADVVFRDVPVDAVDREADVDAHAAVGVVAAEHACIVVVAFLEGHNCGVED